jgi:hypothetical protein
MGRTSAAKKSRVNVGVDSAAGQLWFPAGMNSAEDMVVDHDMVVPQVFRRLGKRLDRPGIAAESGLRINHTSFHHPSSSFALWDPAPDTRHSGPEAAAQSPAHDFRSDTAADYPAHDHRELQTEQTIVGLPTQNFQPSAWSAMAALSVFG